MPVLFLMRVVAFCLMPNHLHLALWPHADGDLSRWMQWLLTTHVRRYHAHNHTYGYVWQGRFKGFPAHSGEGSTHHRGIPVIPDCS